MNPPGTRHQLERSRAGSAGVTKAVKNTFLTQASVTPVRIDDTAAKGHCKAVQIMPLGSDCLIIWGVYIPRDPEEREHVYAMLRSAVAKAEAEVPADRKCFSIMAGDWNAALLEGDRAELTSDDSAHQQLIAEMAMTPTQQRTEQARPATHHPQAENVPSSRADDVLMSEVLSAYVSCSFPVQPASSLFVVVCSTCAKSPKHMHCHPLVWMGLQPVVFA